MSTNGAVMRFSEFVTVVTVTNMIVVKKTKKNEIFVEFLTKFFKKVFSIRDD